MNERIRELAIQAEGTKKHVPAVWQFYDYELEKFAQLIVRECASVIVGNEIDHPITGAVYDGDQAKAIKQHFGVEE